MTCNYSRNLTVKLKTANWGAINYRQRMQFIKRQIKLKRPYIKTQQIINYKHARLKLNASINLVNLMKRISMHNNQVQTPRIQVNSINKMEMQVHGNRSRQLGSMLQRTRSLLLVYQAPLAVPTSPMSQQAPCCQTLRVLLIRNNLRLLPYRDTKMLRHFLPKDLHFLSRRR